MSAGRKPRGGVSFHVVEGGRDLHRVPVLPYSPRAILPPALAPRPARGIALAVLLSLLLWALIALGAVHIVASIMA